MGYDKMIFGNDFSVTMDSNVTQTNNNVIVVGTSGCGKSMSITEANLLYTEESSVVASFAKRSRVEKYIRLFRNRGYEVVDLNFSDPLHSVMGYDPLEYITSYDDISFLEILVTILDTSINFPEIKSLLCFIFLSSFIILFNPCSSL